MTPNRQYAIYARVASAGFDSQERIQEQTKVAQEFLASTGYDAAARVYIDCGVSGATIHRPALKDLLADAVKGKFDAVVCASAHNLARGDAFDVLRDELTCLGVEFTELKERRHFCTIR